MAAADETQPCGAAFVVKIVSGFAKAEADISMRPERQEHVPVDTLQSSTSGWSKWTATGGRTCQAIPARQDGHLIPRPPPVPPPPLVLAAARGS